MEDKSVEGDKGWRVLMDISLPSEPGNERLVREQVIAAVQTLNPSPEILDRLKTAVTEAAMNAIEHGNHFQGDIPVGVQVLLSGKTLVIRITDQGGSREIPEAETPDLEAKLLGLQTPRGWGLFLIKNMVDEMRVTQDKTHHTVELLMRLDP